MADIGKPVRKIKIEPESDPKRRELPMRETPRPSKGKPAPTPSH